jgi:hypothetical protein
MLDTRAHLQADDLHEYVRLSIREMFGSRNMRKQKLDQRATGIEPAWPAWKAGTLPLSYARAPGIKLALPAGDAKFFLASRKVNAAWDCVIRTQLR